MRKLIASDLDGTLLGKEKILSEPVKRAVKKWQDAGNLFVISTGRMIASLEYYADTLNATDYIICCSGGVVYNRKRPILEHMVPIKYVKKLWDIMEETGGYTQVYAGRNLIANRRGGVAERYEKAAKNLPVGYDIPIFYSPKCGDDFPRNIHKLSFTFEDDKEAADILEKMGDISELNSFKSLSFLYDIISVKSSKGLAVKELITKLGLRPEDTYVVGDNENDLSMFENFDNSAVMSNAPTQLHDKASIVLPSVEEDGLVHYIEKILGGWKADSQL